MTRFKNIRHLEFLSLMAVAMAFLLFIVETSLNTLETNSKASKNITSHLPTESHLTFSQRAQASSPTTRLEAQDELICKNLRDSFPQDIIDVFIYEISSSYFTAQKNPEFTTLSDIFDVSSFRSRAPPESFLL